MSGHSKWSTIKHKKGAIDAARGKVFQKLAKEIYVAASNGDPDPVNNATLRMVIEKARSQNMPKDNIQKAIDKAKGAGSTEHYEALRYEGYGPNGIAFMVDCLTDNKNRTASDVRTAFTKRGGNLGTDGSVSYMFKRKGVIVIPNSYNEDEMMIVALDNGAIDFKVTEDSYEIITEPEDFINVKESLANAGVSEFLVSEVTYVSDNLVEVTDDIREKVEKLIEVLEDIDDVQEIYHNMA